MGLGLYFFTPFGLIMNNLLSTDFSTDSYFKDASIPTWDPKRFKPQKPSKPRQRTMKGDYAFIGKEYVPELEKPVDATPEAPKPPEAQVILDQRVKQVFSVVYSATQPEKNGCYLQTPIKDTGDRLSDRTYYYGVGDRLPDHGEGIGFKVKSVDELEKNKKYKIVFVDAKGREAVKEYSVSLPAKYDIEKAIKRR
jgi:hypothetical protein